MSTIKKNIPGLIVILTLIILILIRLSGAGEFKPDLKKRAESSISLSNLITPDQAEKMAGNKLIISLDENDMILSNFKCEVCKVKPDSLVLKTNLDKIFKHKGPVMLSSSSEELSARLWMVLTQMGLKNLYILTDQNDNEVIKYKFQPDTTIGLELDE